VKNDSRLFAREKDEVLDSGDRRDSEEEEKIGGLVLGLGRTSGRFVRLTLGVAPRRVICSSHRRGVPRRDVRANSRLKLTARGRSVAESLRRTRAAA
jgi:hypothetical protein